MRLSAEYACTKRWQMPDAVVSDSAADELVPMQGNTVCPPFATFVRYTSAVIARPGAVFVSWWMLAKRRGGADAAVAGRRGGGV
jgi:hypothetical protein